MGTTVHYGAGASASAATRHLRRRHLAAGAAADSPQQCADNRLLQEPWVDSAHEPAATSRLGSERVRSRNHTFQRLLTVGIGGSRLRLGRVLRRVPDDYDIDPGRWRAHDSAWLRGGDPFGHVAGRIVSADARPVLDVGGGTGALGRALPEGWPVVVLDTSVSQLRDAPAPKLRASALALPVGSSCAGAVAMLWMLYHLDDPAVAIAEAHRVLRDRGVFVAATISRFSDPELTDGYAPTTFDAEDAPTIVRRVFDEVEVVSWDAPLVDLPDREAVVAFCRSHFLPREAADRVVPPVTLTKRGCFLYARK